jgi:predicted nicotinamide N-methyase
VDALPRNDCYRLGAAHFALRISGLFLAADTAADRDRIDKAELGLARLPLESMTVKAGGSLWSLTAARDQDQLLQAADGFEVFPFGLILWESAIVLSNVLAQDPAALSNLDVLELGAGTGLAGLTAASFGARVLQTDHSPEALALCRRNAAANAIRGNAIRFGNWTDWSVGGDFPLVIGADVLYEPDLYASLAHVVSRTVAPGGRLLLTDPGRTHAARFVEDLEKADWDVSVAKHFVAALPPSETGRTVMISVISARRR